MKATFAIEKMTGLNQWSSGGLGESTGWPSKREAVRALRSLNDLARSDTDWAGRYRVINETTSRVVHEETVDGE